MADRFDLEQDILKCWEVVDDLKFYVQKSDEWTEDERMNYLSGLVVKYDKKFQQMFGLFEHIIKQDSIGGISVTHHNQASSDNFRNAYDHEMYLDSLSDR